MNYKFVLKSSNSKIGPISTTYATKENCPDTCALKTIGCYANTSYAGMIWSKLTQGLDKNAISYREMISSIRNLPFGSMVRMNTAGDLPMTKSGKINRNSLKSLISATKNLKVINFTHHQDPDTIEWANNLGYVLIASLDNVNQLPEYRNCPTATVIPSKFARKGTIKNGFSETMTEWRTRIKDDLTILKSQYKNMGSDLKLCPAQYAEDMNCLKCKLCTKLKPNQNIAFAAHGASFKKIDKSIS